MKGLFVFILATTILFFSGTCFNSGLAQESGPFSYESPTLRPAEHADPPRPWAKASQKPLAPGEAGRDYTTAVCPNGTKADYTIVRGVKVFHLVVEPIVWDVADGLTITTWGYNGSVPGPLIELAAGDRVRIYVTNHLPAPTSVHWHGVLLPCGMDGVSGLIQEAIQPGETFRYEFIFPDAGTFMYHPHFDSMTQEGMGLTGMIVVHERQPDRKKRPDRDFVIMLHEWRIDAGASRPNPNEMTDFNVLTMNGKAMPSTEPLVAKLGDLVWIRFGNLSAMDHHPIRLHGYAFKIIGTDGGWAEDKSKLLPETTVLVQVGSAKVVEFVADNPGGLAFSLSHDPPHHDPNGTRFPEYDGGGHDRCGRENSRTDSGLHDDGNCRHERYDADRNADPRKFHTHARLQRAIRPDHARVDGEHSEGTRKHRGLYRHRAVSISRGDGGAEGKR